MVIHANDRFGPLAPLPLRFTPFTSPYGSRQRGFFIGRCYERTLRGRDITVRRTLMKISSLRGAFFCCVHPFVRDTYSISPRQIP